MNMIILKRKEVQKMSNKVPPIIPSDKQVESIGKTALSMLAVGLVAGLTLVAAARRIGELISDEDKDERE